MKTELRRQETNKIYEDNVKRYDAELLALAKRLDRFSSFRLLTFLISGILLIYLLSSSFTTPVFIVLPVSILCFAFFIKRHDKIAHLKKHTAFLKSINESEILREKCV